jgi:hypothetical protein
LPWSGSESGSGSGSGSRSRSLTLLYVERCSGRVTHRKIVRRMRFRESTDRLSYWSKKVFVKHNKKERVREEGRGR